jgi:uncharacterized SAM-binding protein YcdF (DUF218 family)
VRLVAVLGYSPRRSRGLHSVCAARLRHAEELAGDADTVLLSGRSRRANGAGEAELMQRSWNGREVQLLSDARARNTGENAAEVAELARRIGASEIVLVTSRWHAVRARILLRVAIGTRNVRVRTSSPAGRPPFALLARELVCLAAVPYQLMRLRALRSRRGRESTSRRNLP